MLILPNGETRFIVQLQTIDGLVRAARDRALADARPFPPEVVMFVTATQWGLLFLEVLAEHRDSVPAHKLPTPQNFKRLRVGMITVANAGTDDQAAVNAANQQSARECGFSWAREYFKSGHTPDIERIVGHA